MDLLTIILLAIALCFDSFAVSISCGLGCGRWRALRWLRFASVLGFMQGGMVFLGWLIASSFHESIKEWDHWIAFILLLILGVKMIYGAFKRKDEEKEPSEDNLNFGKSIILGIATSIDAIIAGVSVAFLGVSIFSGSQFLNVLLGAFIVMLVTVIASLSGLYLGRCCRGGLGGKIGENAEWIGGAVLILIGAKVLFEHLF